METLREKHEEICLDIDKIIPVNNYVICKRLENHFEPNKGLMKVAKTWHRDQYLTQNVERIFEVSALPKEIEEELGYWKTDNELKIGDKVIITYFASLQSKILYSEGHEYRLINYHEIVAAIRDTLVPINGYFLFTPVRYKIQSMLIIPEKNKPIDLRKGRVEFVGKPNQYYTKGDKEDKDKGIKIKNGDEVIFSETWNKFAPPLESDLFRTLGKEYYYCQRFRIAAINA